MRKKLLYICGILWLFAMFQMISNYEDETEADIITAFSNDMFMETVSSVKGTAFYGSVYLENEEKKKIVEDFAKEMGIQKPYELTESQGKKGENDSVTLIKSASGVTTSVGMVTVENQIEKNVMTQKQYIQVEMEFDNSLESAVYYRDRLDKIFGDRDLSGDIYLNLRGDIEGELSYSEKNSITDHILSNINGKIVTENRGADMFTVYAYSDNIDDYVVYGTTKTNINIVISYNDLTGRTEVYMATPVMNEDY